MYNTYASVGLRSEQAGCGGQLRRASAVRTQWWWFILSNENKRQLRNSQSWRDKNAPSSCFADHCGDTNDATTTKSNQEKRFDSAKNKQYQLPRVKAGALIAGTLPLSELLLSSLSISQSTHCCHQHKRNNRKTAQTKELQSSLTTVGAQSIVRKRSVSCRSAGCCREFCRFHKSHTTVISTQTNTNRETAQTRQYSNRRLQTNERSQLSNKRRDRAIQLVDMKVSVDITKHTLLPSAHEHGQRDSANETIEIVTDK